MTVRFQLATYVSEEVHRTYVERARSRELTAASALRQLVVADLYSRSDQAELRQNILFQTIALDALLLAHSDEDLRERVLQAWRDRIDQEQRS